MSSHENHDNSADDDEDDYGGYFLRPVNEYKIADKIVLANKELFGGEPSLSTDATSLDTLPAGEYSDDCSDQVAVDEVASPVVRTSLSADNVTRRVTFRQDLEDFEPDFITDNEDDDEVGTQGNESVSESDEEMGSDRQNSPISTQNTNNNILTNNRTMDNRCDNEIGIRASGALNPVSGEHVDDCAEEIEEICEVIEDFALVECSEQDRMAVRQTTSTHQRPPEDQEIELVGSASSASDSDNSQIMPLSINKSSTSTIPHCDITHTITHRSSNNDSNVIPPQTSSSNSCKHQRQISSSSSNGSSQPSSAGSTNRSHSAILKIQLNFKPCCEYKHLETNRLPRYCGYFSQYGLSKEQLDRREIRQEKNLSRKCKRIERKAEEESIKSRINEEAFENWLRLKMRNSHTGSRNMYDYNPAGKYRSSKPSRQKV